MMQMMSRGAWLVLAFSVTYAGAQTTVTTNGGAANAITKFSGSATVVNSAISESNGSVGIGTASPQSTLHIVGPTSTEFFGAQAAFTGSDLVLDGNAGGRTVGQGVSMTFAFPADVDGGNHYEQARILATPDNTLDVDGSGRLYLQVRSSYTPPGLSPGWNWRTGLMIRSNGNIGIGTTSPGAMLEINGNVMLTQGSGASLTFPDGTVQATAYTGTCTATGGDYAESVDIVGEKSNYEPGDVMVLDPNQQGHFLRSSEPYSTLVAGIYSTKPGYVGRRQQLSPKLATSEVPMAMIGIVPTKVTAENGPIHIGDLLVTSSTPGYVMKGTDHSRMIGTVVGKAMGRLESGTGVIEVLVSLQ